MNRPQAGGGPKDQDEKGSLDRTFAEQRGQLDKTLAVQREQLDKTLAVQRDELDRTLAEQRTRTLNERFATAAGGTGVDLTTQRQQVPS